jgi:hypothetical protein
MNRLLLHDNKFSPYPRTMLAVSMMFLATPFHFVL